jgi:hypothetical protein
MNTLEEATMTTDRALSPSMLRASKAAAEYKYDSSKYTITNMKVRRDAKTGRLVSKENGKRK